MTDDNEPEASGRTADEWRSLYRRQIEREKLLTGELERQLTEWRGRAEKAEAHAQEAERLYKWLEGRANGLNERAEEGERVQHKLLDLCEYFEAKAKHYLEHAVRDRLLRVLQKRDRNARDQWRVHNALEALRG